MKQLFILHLRYLLAEIPINLKYSSRTGTEESEPSLPEYVNDLKNCLRRFHDLTRITLCWQVIEWKLDSIRRQKTEEVKTRRMRQYGSCNFKGGYVQDHKDPMQWCDLSKTQVFEIQIQDTKYVFLSCI